VTRDQRRRYNGHVRLGFLWLALVGCGRIGIDPRTDAAPIPIDVAPVTCAVDGEACDDRNICTAASTCEGGICSGDGGPCEVANFATDYALVQGNGNWFYGYWHVATDVDGVYQPDDFQTMAPFPGEIWRPPDWEETGDNFTWCYIRPWGGHPGSFPVPKLPIRRWVSDVSGYANVVVRLAKADVQNGDGTRAIVYVDGVKQFERAVAFDDAVGFEETVPVELVVGTRVDVVMDFVVDDAGDTSELDIRITSR
jgi:hypothetical protein